MPYVAPPRPPQLTPALRQAATRKEEEKRQREILQGTSIVRGLVLLALALLAFSIVRAGLDRTFPKGWWHQW